MVFITFEFILPYFDVILLEILPVLFFNLLKNIRQRLSTCILFRTARLNMFVYLPLDFFLL